MPKHKAGYLTAGVANWDRKTCPYYATDFLSELQQPTKPVPAFILYLQNILCTNTWPGNLGHTKAVI